MNRNPEGEREREGKEKSEKYPRRKEKRERKRVSTGYISAEENSIFGLPIIRRVYTLAENR